MEAGHEALITLCSRLGSRWAQFTSFFPLCVESWTPNPGVLLPELQVGTLTVKLFANSLTDKPEHLSCMISQSITEDELSHIYAIDYLLNYVSTNVFLSVVTLRVHLTVRGF